ncbi:MAG TPA: flagellar protein FlaG [Firmicutes bacterium]|nr:flagellar protein FlaG [Bacillota bacterium]
MDVRPLQGAQGSLPAGKPAESPTAVGPRRGQSLSGGTAPVPVPGPAAAIPSGGKAAAEQADMDMIQRVTEAVNSVISIVNTRVTFEIHKETGQVVIKVIDIDTGEVLREIPPRELLGVMKKLAEMVLAGVLVDEKL